MEITTHIHEERCVLELNGRLDANWSEHVGQAIETAIRSGQHHIDLDFGKIHYVSSAGLRILIKYFKQLKSARGSLRIVRPTDGIPSYEYEPNRLTLVLSEAGQIVDAAWD